MIAAMPEEQKLYSFTREERGMIKKKLNFG